jgi:hypothetical protein
MAQVLHAAYVRLFIIGGLTLINIYSVFINLAMKRFSRFGFDAFAILIAKKINPKATNAAYHDPKVIRRMGIVLSLMAIGGIYEIITIYVNEIRPFLH